jgi:hypothetical protein
MASSASARPAVASAPLSPPRWRSRPFRWPPPGPRPRWGGQAAGLARQGAGPGSDGRGRVPTPGVLGEQRRHRLATIPMATAPTCSAPGEQRSPAGAAAHRRAVSRRPGPLDPHPRSAGRSSSALARLRRCMPQLGKPVKRVPPPSVTSIRLAVRGEYLVTTSGMTERGATAWRASPDTHIASVQ